VIPWVELDRTPLPGGGELRLAQRGDEFSIRLDGGELMNSRLSGSEEALAMLACARLATRPSPRLLIGGLGMGFTLRAALAALPPDARVTVAELLPAVVAWAKGPMAVLQGESLQDPRVSIEVCDVAAPMREAGHWDAILLDVDNGPQGLTQAANDGLYGTAGIALARRALTRGGVLAVWSQGPDETFARRLGKAGFRSVEEVKVKAHRGRSGRKHVIWLATT
jgi:spermidine synthase